LLEQRRSALFPYTTLFRSETPGACCLDAHFVNVRITRLEAAAIRKTIADLPEELKGRVVERAQDAVKRFDLNEASTGTYACPLLDRKSTRLNSSHVKISYA